MNRNRRSTDVRARTPGPRDAGPRDLDLDAWRRERDAMARRPRIGAISVDVAIQWSGRVARYQAMREQASATPGTRSPASQPVRAFALSPIERMRLAPSRPGIPRGRCSTLVDTTPALHEVTRDLFQPR